MRGRNSKRYSTPLRLFLYVLNRNVFIATGIMLLIAVMNHNVDYSATYVPPVWYR